eukprot:CAMPEP_0119565376 /NCGR_PEP_ID=MMETSP1352-20130426/29817_1 /TAXON_ID=265584 /ORGANISM="Stauroneis constricta, Strain CCMP1120" /LENGTH=138 /DNA_ID=CAMNT_0007614269 /DNA_START=86 /DNA_END=498 /DNA_ORIENTATION=+
MSTPNQTPPKTPGWTAGLFGIFSTAKKPPKSSASGDDAYVDSGTDRTANHGYGDIQDRQHNNHRHPRRVDFSLASAPSPDNITSPLANGGSQNSAFDISKAMHPSSPGYNQSNGGSGASSTMTMNGGSFSVGRGGGGG